MDKVKTPLDQKLQDFVRGPLIVLVWVVAFAGAASILMDQPEQVDHVAWIPPVEFGVSAGTSGSLAAVLVEPMQAVQKGELIAQLDPRPLEARLATARAEIAELHGRMSDARAETLAEHARLETRMLTELQREAETRRLRFEADLSRLMIEESTLRLDKMRLEVDIASDQVENDLLNARLRRAEQLAGEGYGPGSDVEDLSLQRRQVSDRIARNRDLLEAQTRELAGAEERHAAFRSSMPTGADEVNTPRVPPATSALEAAVRVQALRVAELELEHQSLNLVSPIDGQVSAIYVGEGQAVLAGSRVLSVTSTEAREAMVYMDTNVVHMSELLGRKIRLSSLPLGDRAVDTRIIALAPKIDLLPKRLWKHPSIPAYGRALRVPLGTESVFTPGEVVGATLVD